MANCNHNPEVTLVAEPFTFQPRAADHYDTALPPGTALAMQGEKHVYHPNAYRRARNVSAVNRLWRCCFRAHKTNSRTANGNGAANGDGVTHTCTNSTTSHPIADCSSAQCC
jgi:hypothetical protein